MSAPYRANALDVARCSIGESGRGRQLREGKAIPIFAAVALAAPLADGSEKNETRTGQSRLAGEKHAVLLAAITLQRWKLPASPSLLTLTARGMTIAADFVVVRVLRTAHEISRCRRR